jgi:hypothetical protein
MAKFASDRFPPGFFDLPRDAGETLPVAVIERWTHSDQTRETARALLAPHTLRGTVVSSDSAGLTRLTRELPLVTILAMVDHPKQFLHAYGRAVGGRAIGVWAADNTQMFYPAEVPAERVLGMLLAARDHVVRECEVGVGLCAHLGEYFELGGGVYGPDADRVEVVAEEHTEGGELVVTDTLAERLPAGHAFAFAARHELAAEFGGILRVTDGPRLAGLELADFRYPSPYSADFTDGLGAFTRTGRPSAMPRPVYQDLAVVLIEREREEPDVPEVAALNDLALAAAMKRIGAELRRDLGGTEIKTAGLISLFTFADSRTALDFARAFRSTLAGQGIQSRIGVDAGQVLVFELAPGSRDIAGSAVNTASKLAQDCGVFGRIHVSEAAGRVAGLGDLPPTLRFQLSGVELAAYDV